MRFKTAFLNTPLWVPMSFFLLTFFACCKKKQNCPPDLPCATQSGENTFGCYIDGEPWVAGIAPYVFDPTVHKFIAWYDEVEYGDDYDNRFSISVSQVDSNRFDFIKWFFYDIPASANIVKYPEYPRLNVILYLDPPMGNGYYYLDTLFEHSFNFSKLDTSTNLSSGTFYFRALSEDKLDTLYVSDGRFDKFYHQL